MLSDCQLTFVACSTMYRATVAPRVLGRKNLGTKLDLWFLFESPQGGLAAAGYWERMFLQCLFLNLVTFYYITCYLGNTTNSVELHLPR